MSSTQHTAQGEHLYAGAMAEFLLARSRSESLPESELMKVRVRLEQAREAIGLPKHRCEPGEFVMAVAPGKVVGPSAAGTELPGSIQLEAEFEKSCEEFWAAVSKAQSLCGQFYQTQRTQEQCDSYEAMNRAEARVQAIQEALKNANFGPYLEMKAGDRADAKAKSAAKATGPAKLGVEPANFEQVQAVVELGRRLAIQDYFRHLGAVVDAKDDAEKEIAVANLAAAEKAARLADSAFQSLMAAQAAQRTTTVHLVSGDFVAANETAKASGQHLEIVADKLDRFGAYAPRSRFFQSTMNAVAKADAFAGRIESAVERKVEAFAAGLKGFAQRVRALGDAVKRTPAVVQHMTKSASVSVEKATMTAYASLAERVGALFKRAGERADAAKSAVSETAWNLLDDGADMLFRVADRVDRVIEGAERMADRVDLHVRATAGLAGGLMARVGETVKQAYGESVDKVEVQRAQRRATPR